MRTFRQKDLVTRLRAARPDDCGNEILCDNAANEIERLRDALAPFAHSMRIAREAFDRPTDQGHLTAVAKQYIGIDHLVDAYDAVLKKEGQADE